MRALAALRMVWNVFFTHLFTTVRVHLQFLVFVFRLEVRVAETCRAEQEFVITLVISIRPERPLPNAAPMADIRRERSVREPQETQFVGLTGAILRAVEICGAVLVRAWDAILRLGTKFPSAMWAGTDAILRFGFEFEVGFIALFALVIFIGSRYETVFLLFKSKPGEAIEWELVLCVTLLIVFIGLPLLPLETHIREQKLPAYLLYAMVLVLIFSFIIFDTSVGLVDLLDDGNFTKYDIEERKENLLVSVLNIVLIMSIAQIFYLRTRLQCVTAPVTAPALQPSHTHRIGAPSQHL